MAKRTTKRAYGGIRIKRHEESGYWYVVGTLHGESIRKSTGTRDEREADAFRLALEVEARTEKKEGPKAVASFREIAEEYIRATKKQHTYMQRIIDEIGERRCSEIDKAVMHSLSRKLMPNASEDTVRRHVYTPVMAAMTVGEEKGLCDLPSFKRPKGKDEKAKAPIVNAPDEWIEWLLASIDNQRLRAFVLLVTSTGARRSEALRIHDNNVDWDARTFVTSTKTKQVDVIDLPDVAYEALLPLRGTGLLIGYHKDSVNTLIRRHCEKHGKPFYSTHQYGRHAFATRLLKSGATLQEVKDAGRWKDISMPSRNYAHLERKDVAKKMNAVTKGLGKKS